MQIIQTQPFSALVFETETTLTQLNQLVGSVARELHTDAVSNQLDIAGPIYWVYQGMDGNPDTPFHLTIALPVVGLPKGSTRFKQSNIPAFKCLQQIHYGAWQNMHTPYQALFMEAQHQNLKPSGISRELYIQVDFENPSNNVTWVQLGIE